MTCLHCHMRNLRKSNFLTIVSSSSCCIHMANATCPSALRESGKERAVSASLSSSQTSRHDMCMHECLHVRMCGYTRHTYIHTYVCMNARSIYVYTNLRTYVGFIYLCMRVCVLPTCSLYLKCPPCVGYSRGSHLLVRQWRRAFLFFATSRHLTTQSMRYSIMSIYPLAGNRYFKYLYIYANICIQEYVNNKHIDSN